MFLDIIDRIEITRSKMNQDGGMTELMERVPKAEYESGMFSDIQQKLDEAVQAYSRTNIGLEPAELLALALYELLDSNLYHV